MSKQRERKIHLYAESGLRRCSVEARTVGDRTTILQDNLVDPRRVVEMCSIEGVDSFRFLAEALASERYQLGVPADGVSKGSISCVIKGLGGWRENVVRFCWARIDDEEGSPFASRFLALDNAHLEWLSDQVPDLASPAFLEQLQTFFVQVEEAGGDETTTIDELLDRYDLRGDPKFWTKLTRAVEDDAEGRQALLDRVQQAEPKIREAKLAVVRECVSAADVPMPTGMPSCSKPDHYRLRREATIDHAYEYVARHGRFPKGRHQVAYRIGDGADAHAYTCDVMYKDSEQPHR